MVFCNANTLFFKKHGAEVTILILVDGFLQFRLDDSILECSMSHNPYFSRWFSAICSVTGCVNANSDVTILILVDGFLQ